MEDLLLHVGGLIPDNSLNDYRDGVETSRKNICELKPITKEERDLHIQMSGLLFSESLRKSAGRHWMNLPRQCISTSEMSETSLTIRRASKTSAPTEQRDGTWLKGVTIHGLTFYAECRTRRLIFDGDDLTRSQQMLRLAMSNERLPFELEPSMMTRPRNVERDSKVIGTELMVGTTVRHF